MHTMRILPIKTLRVVILLGSWSAALLAILADSYFHPGLTQTWFWMGLCLGWFGYLMLQKHTLPRWFVWLNTALAITLGGFTFFLAWQEWQHFDNYVFSTWHLHYRPLSYAFFLTWFLAWAQAWQVVPKRSRQWLWLTLPFLLTASALLLRLWPMNAFLEFVKEDRWVEWLQTLFLFGASVFSFLTAWRLRQRQRLVAGLYLVAGIGLFFVAGEEISWGQRLLGIATPAELVELNLQGETTVHNLPGIQGLTGIAYIIIGWWGGLGWVLRYVPWKQKSWQRAAEFITVPWWLALFFLPVGWHNYHQIYQDGHLNAWVEYTEWLMALGFLLVMWGRWCEVRSVQKLSKA